MHLMQSPLKLWGANTAKGMTPHPPHTHTDTPWLLQAESSTQPRTMVGQCGPRSQHSRAQRQKSQSQIHQHAPSCSQLQVICMPSSSSQVHGAEPGRWCLMHDWHPATHTHTHTTFDTQQYTDRQPRKHTLSSPQPTAIYSTVHCSAPCIAAAA